MTGSSSEITTFDVSHAAPPPTIRRASKLTVHFNHGARSSRTANPPRSCGATQLSLVSIEVSTGTLFSGVNASGPNPSASSLIAACPDWSKRGASFCFVVSGTKLPNPRRIIKCCISDMTMNAAKMIAKKMPFSRKPSKPVAAAPPANRNIKTRKLIARTTKKLFNPRRLNSSAFGSRCSDFLKACPAIIAANKGATNPASGTIEIKIRQTENMTT